MRLSNTGTEFGYFFSSTPHARPADGTRITHPSPVSNNQHATATTPHDPSARIRPRLADKAVSCRTPRLRRNGPRITLLCGSLRIYSRMCRDRLTCTRYTCTYRATPSGLCVYSGRLCVFWFTMVKLFDGKTVWLHISHKCKVCRSASSVNIQFPSKRLIFVLQHCQCSVVGKYQALLLQGTEC